MKFNLAVTLRETASAAPDKAVALYERGRLSYGALDDLSDRLAASLEIAGLRPGDRVGVQLPNIPQFLIAYFGILKAGGVFVPLNVLYKAPEVAFHLGHSGARIFITWAGVLAEAIAGAEAAGVREVYAVGPMEDDRGPRPFEQLIAAPANGPRLAGTDMTDTAVIMYTSGTTGRPKGAEMTHMQLYMNADIPGRLFNVQPDDVVITVLPLFHIFGLSSILNVCVRFGCTMSLIPRFDPATVLNAIQRDRATIFEGVPAMFIGLLSYPELDNYDVSSLRIAISGGASIPGPVIDAFEKHFGVLILEGYGLTETASTTTFNISVEERRVYSVGKPIWGTQTQVWDSRGNPLPRGPNHVGEIVTRGLHVMKGYLNNPAATVAAIVDGWFRTGDLGTKDDEGFITIVDRKKDMVLRGGYNVYPREVEEVLLRHDAVAQVAVIAVPDPQLGEEVCAVVVRSAEAEGSDEELGAAIITWSKDRMAKYKYPRKVEFVEAMPLGPSGKVLKRELVERYA